MTERPYKVVPIWTKLDPAKRCSCGEIYTHIPEDGKATAEGLYFNCIKCGSTLFQMSNESKEKIEKGKAGNVVTKK